MARTVLVLVGLSLLLGGGIVHGVWTDRWVPSAVLDRASQRVNALPADLGDWKGTEVAQEDEALQMAGAVADYSRAFRDPQTGESVLVLLLAGKAARMSVHRPEHCYRAAGFEIAGAPLRLTVTPEGEPGTDMWTGVFTRDDPSKGVSQLRIFWTWYAGSKWEAADNPRWAFARKRVLYKLYVIRSMSDQTPIVADPCVRLLGQLLPVLNRSLSEE